LKEIIPEIRPSLKRNVIDLAPGPENYAIPRPGVGIAYKNAHLQAANVTDPDGKPVEAVEIV
jgi:hypothetical protein